MQDDKLAKLEAAIDEMTEYQPTRVSPPGATLADMLEERELTQAELAVRIGRPKKTVNEIIKGRAPITAEIALQLEQALGTPAAFWISREARYREHLARRQAAERECELSDEDEGSEG